MEFFAYRDSLTEYYQSAVVYLHAAKVDSFPATDIESFACGAPVVATAVGGLLEQIIDGILAIYRS